MRVLPVAVDLTLPADGLIDLFLIQCHNPDPIEDGAPGKLPAHISDSRQELLGRFRQWLEDTYCPENPERPYFVITPELAISLGHLDVLRDIVQLGAGSAGVIAGLEFLTREEYCDLVQAMPDMPDPESWTDGIAAAHRLNTAVILLQQNDGRLLQFVQPKRNPSDPEAATHFPCQNALFFRSTNQAQGRRLNFCVQICSDFTDFENVRELRHECEVVCDGRPIDFTVLLERNPDQFAQHFRRSIESYFSPPIEMIDTAPGCLIFANAASEVDGKSEYWGRSMLLFPWNIRHWRTYGSPTYWLHDDKASNHQAVVLREPGACIYWLRYKPHYLVNPLAGSGQPGPFVENHALALKLDGDQFPAQPYFEAIPPVTHWLLSEWSQCQSEFLEHLKERPDEIISACKIAHDLARSDWEIALRPDEKLSCRTIGLYFACFRNEVLSSKKLEPLQWGPSIDSSARRFLSVYALLKSGLPESVLMPEPRTFAHAVLDENTNLSLVSGKDRRVSSIIAATLSKIDTAAGLPDRKKHVIILVSPLDMPDTDALKTIVDESRNEITNANGGADVTDDITATDISSEIIPICDQSIWTAVTTASNMAEIQARIPALLGVEAA